MVTREEVEKILPKKKEHIAILSKKNIGLNGELMGCRTVDNWINFGYNQAIDDCKSALIGKCGNGLSKEKAEEIQRLADRAYCDYIDICKRELAGVEAYVKEGKYEKIMQIIKSTEKTYTMYGRYLGLLDCRNALATPTFSGEKEVMDDCDDARGEMALGDVKSTEQKECLHIKQGLVYGRQYCMDCGKPIPAEK